ncbi:37513_t:CDS:2, partial [Gigaspora margarita]
KKVAKKKVRQSYTIQDKAHVVRYALHTSNIKAAQSANRKCFFPEEEARLYSWISDMCSAALAITYNSLRLEMLKFVAEAASKSNDLAKIQLASTFKASSIWIKRFLKRYNLALYQKTKISQKMLADLEQHLLNFQQYIIQLHYKKNYSLSNIFDIAGNLTVDQIGAKTVHIYTTAWANSYIEDHPDGQENEPSLLGSSAFHKCFISNTMDGSEDDKIYYNKILSNESEEICQDEPQYISDEQNITTIDSSEEENCDAIIDKDDDHDAIIDKEEDHDITIVKNEEVLVFTIDKQ